MRGSQQTTRTIFVPTGTPGPASSTATISHFGDLVTQKNMGDAVTEIKMTVRQATS
jgi:hypothetical protein